MRLRSVGMLSVWLLILLARPVSAHPTPFSYVNINVTQQGISISVTAYAFDIAHELNLDDERRVFDDDFIKKHGDALVRLIQTRLSLQLDDAALVPMVDEISPSPEQKTITVMLHAPPTSATQVRLTATLFPYDPLHQTYANFYDDGRLGSQAILTIDHPMVIYRLGSGQTRLAVIREFVVAGVEHIAIGPDHILFLVGLLLLGGNLWQLVRIVTGFTIAHSLTLSLAALNIVAPPARLIEPLIALSICWVGLDNLIRRPGAPDRRVWMAFGFGFVHGFGFASVLRELNLPRGALGWSLFAFNLGVEIGQLVIVVTVGTTLAWIASTRPALRRRVTIAGSLVVLWAGFFWLVQRIFFT